MELRDSVNRTGAKKPHDKLDTHHIDARATLTQKHSI
jgi:hypothetical protein